MKLNLFTLFLIFTQFVAAQVNVMDVNVKPLSPIQSTMYGLFFEDINYAADGGLYAELIKNRSFEFPQSLMGWSTFGKVDVRTDGPFERNPHYARLSNPGHGAKSTGMENEGFFGIGVKKDAEYRFTVWARLTGEGSSSSIRIELVNPTAPVGNHFFTQAQIRIDSKEWKKYTLVIKSTQTNPKARLRIFLSGASAVDLEHVSLFPIQTWKGRANGLRNDLMQALADIRPGVFRFPGGCIVEGTDLATRYNWKNSVGDVENRPLNENRWQHTFGHRFYPDYFQSYGLGFYEYFLLCEDIGAEPLPVVSCGLACQFQNTSMDAHVPVSQLQPYIQDALDLIEFANGDTSSTWGKLRAQMGHPAPFNLKLLAVGNEQWGPEYVERLEPFVQALRKKYPAIRIIGSSGPDSEGSKFSFLWPEMKRVKVDLVDEHFYRNEQWFLNQGTRYDSYDRKGPKIFAGEYACHGAAGKNYNHFNASLMEAAFMTGLERNADIVHMATYAPLFAHYEGYQWRPDLIWYDNLNAVKTSSYYVQQLYSLNKGTNVLSLTSGGKPVAGTSGQNGLFASACWDAAEKVVVVKIANTSDVPQQAVLNFVGLKKNEKLIGLSSVSLHSDPLIAENSVEQPNRIVPVQASLSFEGTNYQANIPARTFQVLKFKR